VPGGRLVPSNRLGLAAVAQSRILDILIQHQLRDADNNKVMVMMSDDASGV